MEIAPDEDYAFADRIGHKCGGDLRAFDGPDDRRCVVTLKPERVTYRG